MRCGTIPFFLITTAAELHNKPVQLLHALLLPARLHPSASLCKLTQLLEYLLFHLLVCRDALVLV